LPEAWSLDDPRGDEPNHRRRGRAADHRQRIEGGRLFRHDAIDAETGKASAHPFECGDRGSEAAPSHLVGKRDGIADAGIRERGDQVVIAKRIACDRRPRRIVGSTPIDSAGTLRKQVELLGGPHCG
jgi:hypothetical protein